MASRDEKKAAKKEAGLCLHGDCGNKADLAPLSLYCERHRGEDPYLRPRRGRKKPPPSN